MAPGDECQTVKTDPEQLALLLNTYVSVQTADGDHKGFVDAIDPHSKSIILSTDIDNVSKTLVLMGHIIKEINRDEAPSNCRQYIIPDNQDATDTASVDVQKRKVFNWLVRNLLPVQDKDGVLDVHDGNLQIVPPYRPTDCISSNTIILGRIQHLLQNIPKDLTND